MQFRKVCKLIKVETGNMIKENKVSLWLGFFENIDDFKSYINGSYDEKGNYIPSKFQENYDIKKYDLDAIETDWISNGCPDVESLLTGFSRDFEIIPQFKKILKHKKIQNYNSIILLYNFEYENNNCFDEQVEYIGCAEVSL